MESIRNVKNLKGKRVIVRASLNEPIKNGKIHSDFRLKKMIPIIKFLQDVGAKTILIGHLSGNPESKTLLPVLEFFNKKFSVVFVNDPFDDEGKKIIAGMKEGDVALLENIRKYSGETSNDMEFAERLSTLGDLYVNDNFSAAHRKHASIVGIPTFLPSYMGIQFEKEIKFLTKALKPPRPSLAIIGGAKPETKAPLVRQFLEVSDNVFAGGLTANEFFLAKGYLIGTSLSSGKDLGVSNLLDHKKLLLPLDLYVLTSSGKKVLKLPNEVTQNDRIVDIGNNTLELLSSIVRESAFILWNGPLSDSDLGFTEGTYKLAQMIAGSGAYSVVGGGDTVGAVETIGIGDKFTFLSTAGAAMMDFLADGTLPGIEALKKSSIKSK